MACSIPPMYWSTGIQRRAAAGSKGRSSLKGSQNRRKYQLESTNVSMVSVSRRGGPPAGRAGGVEEPGVRRQRRLPGREELDVVGGEHGQLVLGDGHDAVVRAVHDGDRAAPEPLARDQPVAQAVVDLAASRRRAPRAGRWRATLARRDVEAVEEPAVDLLSFAVVGTSPGLLPVGGRLHGADDRQPVGLREGEVPLVLGRHRHDRPGAVAHQDVVGHVHRHRLAGEGVEDAAAGEGAPLLGPRPGLGGGRPLDLGGRRRPPAQLVHRRPLLGSMVSSSTSGCSGATTA